MSEGTSLASPSLDENKGTDTVNMSQVRISASRASNAHHDHIGSGAGSAPTFFDGTYFSSAPEGNVSPSDNAAHVVTGYSVPAWRYLYNGTLIALDLLMTIIATCLVFLLRPSSYIYVQNIGPGQYGMISFLALACVSWVISLYAARSYERHTMGEGYALYAKLLNAAFIDFIMLCTLGYLFHLNVPRSLNVFIPLISLVLVILERWLMRRALHRNHMKGEFNYPTVVVGSPEGIHKTLQQLDQSRNLGYAPIAVCPIESVENEEDPNQPQHLIAVPFTPLNDAEARLKVLSLNSHLPQTAKRMKARTVLVTDVLTRDSETMRTLSLAVESMGIELAMTTSVADLSGADLHFRNDPSIPIVTAQLSQYSTITRILKRLCDIVLSSVAIILSSPIMLWVAYKVKREDGGPVFYSQTRVGIYGKPFTMYKFRSMRTDADKIKAQLAKERGIEDRFIFKLKDDPRVTKIGHFIRKTSLDEFPQFFNVFKGDMSLVGPRPPLPEEVAKYNMLYSTRLLVKPGITGPWQISGRSDLSQEQSEYADVSYIQDWSITGDIAILFKTVGAVLKGTGSY
ncbi:exopolysaccharide biosynthesis polyprenyl glycosylphosphotransferase [Bifidobacterium felsineum]|uniref:Exopolysaccharide biosynthesis polyprenyl glycosylphosphotransferase n=2 Tax=Bifidobacterium felsineum TaxID=2045440 RepID=A0A2M9HIL1_9BIFI|nr:sugar transferase [Bifidobacterium felsineum]PJM76627.1 exopolysaccharide biosynthesis polyprenyl glycosylphosphotransferase [Bifidobacterium felsineum]